MTKSHTSDSCPLPARRRWDDRVGRLERNLTLCRRLVSRAVSPLLDIAVRCVVDASGLVGVPGFALSASLSTSYADHAAVRSMKVTTAFAIPSSRRILLPGTSLWRITGLSVAQRNAMASCAGARFFSETGAGSAQAPRTLMTTRADIPF